MPYDSAVSFNNFARPQLYDLNKRLRLGKMLVIAD